MRCFSCGKLSLFNFCRCCKNIILSSQVHTRQIDGLKIYCMHYYSEIKPLLLSKYKFHGSFVLKSLSKLSFSKFDFSEINQKICIVPLDDIVERDYSHTAIIARNLASVCKNFYVRYNVIRSDGSIKYSGKTLKFRKNNPKQFILNKNIKDPVILVDDIVTTGQSLNQAKKLLQSKGINVLCAVVLADTKQ